MASPLPVPICFPIATACKPRFALSNLRVRIRVRVRVRVRVRMRVGLGFSVRISLWSG
jgi:hypothetical protein